MSNNSLDDEISSLNQQISHQKQQIAISEKQSVNQTWWTTTNAMTMSACVLIFGLIVIAFATYLIRKEQTTEAVLKIFGTILIIVIAVFLVVAGYSDKQIAPVMGLLGTIAGYLLGKDIKSNKNAKE